MATFNSDGVEIAFDDVGPRDGGRGRPLILAHGFSSNRLEGWRRTGWYAALERRGTRFIAFDQRGHGESGKPHDPAQYARHLMAGDTLRLMDHLGIERADLFGYSMGTRTSLSAAIAAPDRFSNLVLGGTGIKMVQPQGPGRPTGPSMAEAMLTDDLSSITNEMQRSFRQFAEEQGEDRHALAACTQAPPDPIDLEGLRSLPMPVLVATGDHDDMVGDPRELADLFPYGKAVVLRACDHMSAIPNVQLKAAVFDFLDGIPDEDEFPPFQ